MLESRVLSQRPNLEWAVFTTAAGCISRTTGIVAADTIQGCFIKQNILAAPYTTDGNGTYDNLIM